MSIKDKEEEPFQKIRLTLSEVALDNLAILRGVGYFRSDSATVEECIRSIYDISDELRTIVQKAAKTGKPVTMNDQNALLLRIAIRVKRFIPEQKEKQKQ